MADLNYMNIKSNKIMVTHLAPSLGFMLRTDICNDHLLFGQDWWVKL